MSAVKLRKAHIAIASIMDLIDRAENRCMAADGPVTPTLQEMTEAELRAIYHAARRAEQWLAELRGIKRRRA